MKDYKRYSSIPNFYKYPEEGILENYEIKEKIDGTNIRFCLIDDDIVVGSRNVFPLDNDQPSFLTNIRDWIIANIDPDDLIPGHMYFAEGRHTVKIAYEWDKTTPIVGFDVYDMEQGFYLDNWKLLFDIINIPTTKSFGTTSMNAKKKVEELKNEIPKSFIDGKSMIEGFVFRDYENGTVYKYKTDEYVNAGYKSNRYGKKSKYQKFIDKYFTEDRMLSVAAEMEEKRNFNPRDPVPSWFQNVLLDIAKEASARDLLILFPNEFSSILSNILNDHDHIKDRVLGLMEENNDE